MEKIRIASAIALTIASSAAFSEGVIEINQVTALAGGVTPGDGPGFPATISTPRSYVACVD